MSSQIVNINALIHLIDDPDEQIYAHVKDQLIDLGQNAIPSLEKAWELNDFGYDFQSRIENIIHEIQFESRLKELTDWANTEDRDLLEGSTIVARYQYPDLNSAWINDKIEEIRRDIWLEINHNMTAFEKVKVFNKVFFGFHEFTGNKKNFHSPQNNCINDVLDLRRGNPLSLSIVYSIVAQELGMPVYGVNLPNHFVLAYLDHNNIQQLMDADVKDGILFYINPFSKGVIFNRKEIEQFLDQIEKTPKKSYYEPCSNSKIIQLLITNLMHSYQKLGYLDKVEELKRMMDCFK